jgi:hypothetical protein
MSRARLSPSVALEDALENVVEYAPDQTDIAPSLRVDHAPVDRRTRISLAAASMRLKILVTGGAGYIGSHTCKALAAARLRAGRAR